MRPFSLTLLLITLAACRKTAPPAPPTPEALGAELATFRQVLMPLTPEALNTARSDRPNPYALGSVLLDGRPAAVFAAYAGPWLAPREMLAQPMSIQQFLSAFGNDRRAGLAEVIAPKGALFFTREQLPDVIRAARAAGASDEALPFTIIRGAGQSH